MMDDFITSALTIYLVIGTLFASSMLYVLVTTPNGVIESADIEKNQLIDSPVWMMLAFLFVIFLWLPFMLWTMPDV